MPSRKFIALSSDNQDNCNLTDLNAALAVDIGYMVHSDWLGHNTRYLFAWKQLTGPLKDCKTWLDVGSAKLDAWRIMWRNRCSAKPDCWALDLRAQQAWLPAEDAHWQVPMTLVKCDVVNDDLTTCEGWPGQFDLVTCFEVLEHLPRAKGQELLRRLHSWTKPGGTCLFSTPNAGVSDTTADNHKDPVTGESREWTYDEKIEAVEEAGFVVEETFGTFCGTTRLPEDVQERFKTDPILKAAKRYLTHAAFTTMVCCAYPEQSNNALFKMTRS